MSSSPRFHDLVAEAKKRIREVSPAEAFEQQQVGAALIDVRESDEFVKEHAKGAIHLSRGIIEWKIEGLFPKLQTPIICYCGGGSRSALAVESLQRMGYTNVASLAGGFKGWKEHENPIA